MGFHNLPKGYNGYIVVLDMVKFMYLTHSVGIYGNIVRRDTCHVCTMNVK